MKNLQIDALAAQDIQSQVDKILRGLDNPEPPLDLREVRELLNLDRQFYSTTDAGWLRESVSRVKVGAKQLAMRPTLMLEVVRQARLKAPLDTRQEAHPHRRGASRDQEAAR